MRVLQIHNRYRQPGGEDAVVEAEARLLRSSGHEVAQFLVENPTRPIRTLLALASAPSNPVSASKVSEAVLRAEPDVVHIHNTWFQLSPAVATAAHAQVPVVLTVHNYRLACANAQLLRRGEPCRLCLDGSLWNGVIHSCYHDPLSSGIAALTIARGRRRVWPQDVDLFLTLSRFASEVLAQTGLPRELILQKDNFVDDPGPRTRPAADSRDVLFVGRLSPEKGLRELLQHQGLLAQAGLDLKVIGDGPLRTELGALGGSLLGRIPPDRLAAEMLAARALIMPSLWFEGQPRTALEAFAAGLPVLGSGQGAIGELLTTQGAEWVFDPRGDWEGAIAILSDDARIAQGSHQARQIWETRFGPDQASTSLLAVYQAAIDRHHRHG